ncbi:hypothetical protein QBC35DRAFT_84091 [Podospora australis]|uniref:Uncharacterized protein n=1 Tax=Podospora australis TaxID=1536484 RepID=A0AAN6WL39_9PEZI|nr:hypothetical protein QBC35DRAFT_84091 [Podospora australis]
MYSLRAYILLASLAVAPTPSLSLDADRYFDPNPKLNFRPENVTSIPYWLYAWVGSYYNGTTTFRLSPMDTVGSLNGDEEPLCRAFVNRTLTLSYPSLLAITKPDKTNKDETNLAMLLLKTWRPGMNMAPPRYLDHFPEQINQLPWKLQSIEPPRRTYSSSSPNKPLWNMTLSPSSGGSSSPPFTITGTSSEPRVPGLQLNASSCNNPQDTWWGVSFMTKETTGLRRNLPPGLTDPSFRVQFDRQSASFQYVGFFRMNTDPGNKVLDNGDEEADVIVGMITVDFLGSIDPERSDVLESSSEGKPVWTPVIGWGNGTGTIDAGEKNSGVRVGTAAVWGWLVLGVLMCLLI